MGSGRLLLRSLGSRRELHFALTAEDRTPVFVFGNGHSALDTYADAGLRRFGLPKQFIEQ